MRKRIPFPAFAVVLLLLCAASGQAQSRDYLTAQEVELVKEAQMLDKRIDVFIKAAERRMTMVTGAPATSSKQSKKDVQKEAELWGEMPTGSRAELIGDIAKILDEAITNIDDVSLHDEKSPLLPKALRKLSAWSGQLINQLTPMRAQAKSEAELGNLEQALENAQSIIDAAKKLPPPGATEKGQTKKPKEP